MTERTPEEERCAPAGEAGPAPAPAFVQRELTEDTLWRVNALEPEASPEADSVVKKEGADQPETSVRPVVRPLTESRPAGSDAPKVPVAEAKPAVSAAAEARPPGPQAAAVLAGPPARLSWSKTARVWAGLGLAAILLAGIGMGWRVFSGVGGPGQPVRAAATAREHEVVYSVRGSARSVSLIYEDGRGGSEQEVSEAALGANLSWSRTFRMTDGALLHLSAQNRGQDGTVTAEISVDGVQRERTTSQGAFAIAHVGGRL